MRRCVRVWLLVWLLGVVSLATAGAEPVAPADPLGRFLKGLHSFEADFEQALYDEKGRRLEQSSGRMYLNFPGSFHWAYTQPYTQQIISDGETLWLYDEDLEQVIIRSVTDAPASPASIFSGEDALRENFVLRDLGPRDGYDWVELSPLDADAAYLSIRLAFDEAMPGAMLIIDNLEQVTRIDFLRGVRNAPQRKERFTMNIPAGIDVIDERSSP